MRDSARALRLFAIAWAARSFVGVSLGIAEAANGRMALSLSLALVVAGTAALAKADAHRRVRAASATVATLLALRVVLPSFVNVPYEPARFLEIAALGCAFATARSAGAKPSGWLAGLAAIAAGVNVVREWLPPPPSFFAAETRGLLFVAASTTVAAWGILVPLQASSELEGSTKEDPAAVTRRRLAVGLRAWLVAALLFVGSAIYLAAEKMPTWKPVYVEVLGALFASAGAVTLVDPAQKVSRRRACIAAAIAWALQGATLYLAVRFAQALLWDAMDGRPIAPGVNVATGIAQASWVLNIAGVALVSAILHGFARHLGRELLSRIALAANFPLAVGVLLELTRVGERPRSGWVDLAFAGCSFLTYGMLAFAAYRILFAPGDEPQAISRPARTVTSEER